ncbi:hypothetical protein R6Q59_006725 [Mikania micrantha]
MKGQADTIGIAMQSALLGEIEGTCITRAKSEKISHEYSTIMGIQESVHKILINLKEIVLRSNLYGTCEASTCVRKYLSTWKLSYGSCIRVGLVTHIPS